MESKPAKAVDKKPVPVQDLYDAYVEQMKVRGCYDGLRSQYVEKE